jgi:hypothetical protein
MSSLAEPDEQPHFDRSDMLMIHNMFRREFALMPGLVGAVVAGEHDRAQIIGDHVQTVTDTSCTSTTPTKTRTSGRCCSTAAPGRLGWWG